MTFHPKKELKFSKYYDPILCDFAYFGVVFYFRSALHMQKCIVKSCCEYLKHSLDSGKYVSKRIVVIRCVELTIKQEMTFYPKKQRMFPKSQDLILCDFASFEGALRNALHMWKCIVESRYEYLKHFLDSGEYVSKKKNHGRTMRRTEI